MACRPRSPTVVFAKMPLTPIDNRGTSIYYEDSGAPNGCSVYTTLVFVHGAFSNSGASVVKVCR